MIIKLIAAIFVFSVFSLPVWAQDAVEKAPEAETPEMTDVEAPEVPEMAVPDAPEMPEVDAPDMPEVEAPDVPDVEAPEVPEIDVQDPFLVVLRPFPFVSG